MQKILVKHYVIHQKSKRQLWRELCTPLRSSDLTIDSLSWTPGSFSQCICLWDENDCMEKCICGDLVLKLHFMCSCVCMCVGLCTTVEMWRSGDNLKELVLSWHHEDTKAWTQMLSFGDGWLYTRSHLIKLYFSV